jgi:hypothetical protein
MCLDVCVPPPGAFLRAHVCLQAFLSAAALPLAVPLQADIVCYLPGHPLLALACEGQAELLLTVLQQGADPDAQDCRGCTGRSVAAELR